MSLRGSWLEFRVARGVLRLLHPPQPKISGFPRGPAPGAQILVEFPPKVVKTMQVTHTIPSVTPFLFIFLPKSTVMEFNWKVFRHKE